MSFYTSLNGLKNAQTQLSVVSHNIANAETTGFKKSRASFQDLLYETLRPAGGQTAAGNTVPEVRQIFDKAAEIDNISSISGRDLDISKEGDKVIVKFAYNKEIHMFGPAYLLLKYAGRSR